ncbi:MAG: hypothetical protein G8D81_00750 [gamma proteobacterium symbiont of Clathrolucina costata]|uniref:Uncharacterized protein n=1 Tax=Candidatus Thiodiazotropha taylori TaxID=2792791 RepID=A0A9E4NNI4_9GAMM|nr:hypothetical protein [Candidatus Thiodiazotropha taylori]MCW4238251.1 hypothetical protein [Candidatus Thiodiazotropha endolucinida]
MALLNYKASGLLFNNNFLEETSEPGIYGYRGELVLVEGGVADTKGHAKPPVEVMRGVAILSDEKIKMLIGAIDQLESLSTFIKKYKDDFKPHMEVVIYVVNIDDPIQVEIENINFVLIPLVQGVPWNEMIDELGLEKSDFKGQSAADKVLTLYSEMKDYKPKYPTMSLDDALASTNDTVREGWGAV